MTTITNEEQEKIAKASELRQKKEVLVQLTQAAQEVAGGLALLAELNSLEEIDEGINILHASLCEIKLALETIWVAEPTEAVGQPSYTRNAHLSVGGEEQ